MLQPAPQLFSNHYINIGQTPKALDFYLLCFTIPLPSGWDAGVQGAKEHFSKG